ncbi:MULTISPECIES: DUF4861 family protein [Flagellimonas]|uniref:DUF4861 domain-containing protein n=1 Tax=Flagellimonas hadalis TaxID=2597517 RepID=A0A5N5IQ26_9FLAO|nr:DUF4861 family protein [Allomuricauda hadalis]KAB5485736.1 DUF4861 domain-containing protein [Allomuricauda hadalis]RUA11857.1 MAG: DUF4861 domain-containing protein [Flavobacteriia bacterium]
MKHIVTLSGIVLLGFTACKQEKKEAEKKAEVVEVATAAPYAEISIKEGGTWEDGPRGHKEYIGGTFKNVEKMTVPEEHTDHSWYIRYEGPGWENKNVGYRLYLDWRNAIDIYGKKVDSLVLPYVGQDGFDSYHEMSDWGLDILKAGKSMGIGGYGRFVNDSVVHFQKVGSTMASVESGKDAAIVTIDYKGWEAADITTDLKTTLSIYPEDRFTKAELKPSTAFSGLSTGIVKFDHVPLKSKTSSEGKWGYIATYGNQTLVNDTDLLGMAVFYKMDELDKMVEGPHDHLMVFKPTTSGITYYFLGAWEQELNGITNEADFFKDLDGKLEQLDQKGTLEQ